MKKMISILIAVAILTFAVSSQTIATPVIPLPPPTPPDIMFRIILFWFFGQV